jgi:hypothetical protein
MPKKAIEKISSSETLQLVFTGQFEQSATGELKPGAEVTILFDASRLPFERSSDKKGKPEWTISAYCQFAPDGAVSEVRLAPEKAAKKATEGDGNLLKGTFTVPAEGREAIIWFVNTGRSGNVYFDSDFGKNYHFPVLAAEPAPETPVKKTRAKKAS